MSQAAAIAIRLSLLLLLTGCHYAPAITPVDVQHHHWTLISINGATVAQTDNTRADLEIGEKMTVNGHTGCRRFVGQGQLEANRLKITSLYLTGQRCPVEKEWIEKAILTTLKSEAALQMSDKQLVVRGEQYVLHYQLTGCIKSQPSPDIRFTNACGKIHIPSELGERVQYVHG